MVNCPLPRLKKPEGILRVSGIQHFETVAAVLRWVYCIVPVLLRMIVTTGACLDGNCRPGNLR